MQGSDGHLVLYKILGENKGVVWSTGVNGFTPSEKGLHFDKDGRLVIYDDMGTLKWHVDFPGKEAEYLKVEDDGNVVVYDKSGQKLWVQPQ